MSKPIIQIAPAVNQVDCKLVGHVYKSRFGVFFGPLDMAEDYTSLGYECLAQVGILHSALPNVCDTYPLAEQAYSFNRKLRGCFANVNLFTARRAMDNAEITVTSDDLQDPEKKQKILDWGFGTEVFLCVAWNQMQDSHKWYKVSTTQPKMRYVEGLFSVEPSPWGDDFVFASHDEIIRK